MAEPCFPTPSDRLEVHRIARAVLEAVRADESVAKAAGLKLIRTSGGDIYESNDVHDLLAALSLEITAQSERVAELEGQLAEAIELADEGWAYADNYFRVKWNFVERIAAIRATGSGK